MKLSLCLLLFLFPFLGRSGVLSMQPENGVADTSARWIALREKCDSILADADQLYKYELAAWVTGDIASERGLRARRGGYFSYGEGDSTRSLIYDADSVLLFAFFHGDACYLDTLPRLLTPWERGFVDMRRRLIDTVFSGRFPVRLYDGFDPNFVLMEQEQGYKLYLLMGTQRYGAIPFGNDYVFFADSLGRITNWRQLHRSLLSTDFGDKALHREFIDGRVKAVAHSHLASEPMITATDICLMRLYGPMYGVDTLTVLAPSLDLYFVYSVGTNTISCVEMKKDQATQTKSRAMKKNRAKNSRR